jgi:DNA repair protein RadC
MFEMNDLSSEKQSAGPEILPGWEALDSRGRFAQFGARGLTDAELLGWVLGRPEDPEGLDRAERLLGRFGSLAGVAGAPPAVLAAADASGPQVADRLLAAVELGMRALGPVARSGILVRRPEDLHQLLSDSFRGLDRERFLALYLDTRHRVQSVETVSVGSLNASLVHPREVFKTAIGMSAAALIVAHNHPSGCPEPSGDDLELTARLAGCGELLGIALLDHLVFGDGEIISIREHGWPEPARD